ncbi:MAG: FHA domain-containing protein kinase, partial [Cyanobacteria bacterium J06649_11]
MITLTLVEAQNKTPLENWRFDESTLIRVGRAADNDIVLDSNLVSRYHLELINTNSANNTDSWEIISKGTNGTFLNGVLVTKAPLPANCFVQLARGGPILKLDFSKSESQQQPKSAQVPDSKLENCTHEGNSPDNLFCIYCGKPLSVELTIRHYQVLRTLGKGGMGTTYLAWDPTGITTGHPKLLVLKQMNADMAKIAKAQELFRREAHTLGLLNHLGIPKYYDFFMEDKKKYLAMELVHGQDLEKFVYRKGPVNVSQAIEWMMQTCDILDYL